LARLKAINLDLTEGTVKETKTFHTAMEGVLNETIDPGSATLVKRRCNNIDLQRSMLRNYGPKCLLEAGYHDLSMPQVDSTYLIGQWPDHLQEGSPLYNVCHRIYEAEDTHRTYGNRGNWSDKPPVEKAVSLLSRAALREMHRYREIAEVCFSVDLTRNDCSSYRKKSTYRFHSAQPLPLKSTGTIPSSSVNTNGSPS
jgi:hypothetical protein